MISVTDSQHEVESFEVYIQYRIRSEGLLHEILGDTHVGDGK